jgi:hypothetical protein
MHDGHRTRRVAAALIAVVALNGAGLAQLGPSDRGPVAQLQRSHDVEWLERIASSAAYARQVQGGSAIGAPKALRVAAFARLGALGTSDSLAAVARVERTMAASTLTPATVTLDIWPSIAWHMRDAEIESGDIALAPPQDGVTYAVTIATLVGGRDLFLISSHTPDDRASWSRPRLVGPAGPIADLDGAALAWRGPRTLVLTAGRDTLQIALDEVARDSDGDGWTDLEEARLGTNPDSVDSDRDGLPDGGDVCPLYAKPPGTDEPSEILQSAIFAAIAMTGSRQLLYVTPQTPRVHVAGYAGPVIFDRAIPRSGDGRGATYVSWKIASRTDGDAIVEITDWEGMLAGGGQEVTLKRIAGRWVAVAIRATWIS